MAFIGLIIIMVLSLVGLIALGVFPIILGTHLVRNTERKKLGTFLRIIGYVFILPILAHAVIFVLLFFL